MKSNIDNLPKAVRELLSDLEAERTTELAQGEVKSTPLNPTKVRLTSFFQKERGRQEIPEDHKPTKGESNTQESI